MTFTRDELKNLLLPVLITLALLAAGGALIWSADKALAGARLELATAQAERRQNAERLARISEE